MDVYITRLLELGANAATAIAVFFAAYQLRLGKQQAVTEFEDNLAREYRELVRQLPAEALLGKALSEQEVSSCLPTFIHYINLSNEQVFLRKTGRITDATWQNWCDGIRMNLSRPGFSCAWAIIKENASCSFEELKRLESSRFQEDPRQWGRKRNRESAHNTADRANGKRRRRSSA
jgi:hypothetical protein